MRFRELAGSHFSYLTLQRQFEKIKNTVEVPLPVEISNPFDLLAEAEPIDETEIPVHVPVPIPVPIPVPSNNYHFLLRITFLTMFI